MNFVLKKLRIYKIWGEIWTFQKISIYSFNGTDCQNFWGLVLFLSKLFTVINENEWVVMLVLGFEKKRLIWINFSKLKKKSEIIALTVPITKILIDKSCWKISIIINKNEAVIMMFCYHWSKSNFKRKFATWKIKLIIQMLIINCKINIVL